MPSLRRFALCLLLALCSSLSAAESATADAPDFALPLLLQDGTTGDDVALSDYQGQVIYLDFWASWCAPCRKSLPWANSLYQSLKVQGFVVLAVNLDEEASMASDFLQQIPLDFPVLFDATGRVSSSYQLVGMPTSFIIDRQGRLRAVHTGFNPKSAGEVEDAIRTILAEPVDPL